MRSLWSDLKGGLLEPARSCHHATAVFNQMHTQQYSDKCTFFLYASDRPVFCFYGESLLPNLAFDVSTVLVEPFEKGER